MIKEGDCHVKEVKQLIQETNHKNWQQKAEQHQAAKTKQHQKQDEAAND